MPRIIILCSGICLLGTIDLKAQSLPKNPTAQQVVGYHTVEQQRWNTQQLPQSSVLYKATQKYPGSQSKAFSFKNEKQPSFMFSSAAKQSVQYNESINSLSSPALPFLQSNLAQHKQLYSQWQKENRLKELQGSMLLKDFLIQSKNKNSLQQYKLQNNYH